MGHALITAKIPPNLLSIYRMRIYRNCSHHCNLTQQDKQRKKLHQGLLTTWKSRQQPEKKQNKTTNSHPV